MTKTPTTQRCQMQAKAAQKEKGKDPKAGVLIAEAITTPRNAPKPRGRAKTEALRAKEKMVGSHKDNGTPSILDLRLQRGLRGTPFKEKEKAREKEMTEEKVAWDTWVQPDTLPMANK